MKNDKKSRVTEVSVPKKFISQAHSYKSINQYLLVSSNIRIDVWLSLQDNFFSCYLISCRNSCLDIFTLYKNASAPMLREIARI